MPAFEYELGLAVAVIEDPDGNTGLLRQREVVSLSAYR
jgi:hypothetical protein